MRHYLTTRWPEWLLCAAISGALSNAICAGFVLEDLLSNSVLLTLLFSLLVQTILYLFAINRRTTVIGITVGALLLIIAILYGRSVQALQNETEHSLFVALLVLSLSGVITFLLARTRPGLIVLFLLGVLLQAGSHFLQFPAAAWSFVLFLSASFVLFFYRCYRISMERALLGTTHPTGYTAQSVLACVLAVSLALGGFFGIVRPLNPPTQDLRLITVMKSMELFQVLGVSSVRTVIDEEDTSSQPPEEQTQGNLAGEELNEDTLDSQSDDPDDSDLPEQQTPQENPQTISYPTLNRNWLWLLLLIPIALLIAILIKVQLRRRRVRKMMTLPFEQGVLACYPMFLRCLSLAGFERAPSQTLLQFANANRDALQPFAVEGADFESLTLLYQGVLYGGTTITAEDHRRFRRFYNGLYPALRKQMGLFRYLLNWFRL